MPGAAGQLEHCSSSAMSLGIARGCFWGSSLLASVLQDASPLWCSRFYRRLHSVRSLAAHIDNLTVACAALQLYRQRLLH